MISVKYKIQKFVNKRTVTISFLLILIYFGLQFCYRFFVSPNYHYYGFRYDPDLSRYLISSLTFFILIGLSLIVYNNGELYYSIYILLIVLFFIPCSILYSFMSLPHRWYLLYCIMILIFFMVSFVKFRIKDLSLTKRQEGFFLFGIVFLFGLPFFLNIGSYKINLNVLFFKEIYETRANFSANSTGIVNYSFFWLIKILAPILFVYGMIRKRYLFSIIAFTLLSYIYLVSGHRTVYFALFTLLIFYALKDNLTDKIIFLLGAVLISMIVVVPVLDMVFSSKIFRFMLYERIFFDQSLVSFYYFDFFDHQPIYFSESMLFDKIFTYPYDLPSANLIGSEYYGNPQSHANTGIIGDSFMSLGFTGVVIISLLFSLIFSFFNSLSIDERYFGIFIIYIFDFQNSSFLSILFSGGLIFLMIFGFLIMKRRPIYEG